VTPEASLPASLIGTRNDSQWIDTEGLLRRYLRFLYDDYKFASWGLEYSELEEEILRHARPPVECSALFPLILNNYRVRRKPRAKVVVFKEGLRALSNYRVVTKRFPLCRILYLSRDPRAIFGSQKLARSSRYPLSLSVSSASVARTWVRNQTISRSLCREDQFLEIRYEDLVESFPEISRKVFRWLDCDFEERLSEDDTYAHAIPPEQRHLHGRLQNRPDNSRIEAWRIRLTAGEHRLVLKMAEKEMIRQGYTTSDQEVDVPVGLDRLWNTPWVDRLREILFLRIRKFLKLTSLLRRPYALLRWMEARRLHWV
jgi:hypothetical protein